MYTQGLNYNKYSYVNPLCGHTNCTNIFVLFSYYKYKPSANKKQIKDLHFFLPLNMGNAATYTKMFFIAFVVTLRLELRTFDVSGQCTNLLCYITNCSETQNRTVIV